MKLIINADDLGYSKSINKGIYESIKKGIVTSTTVMVNMPDFEDAFQLFKNEKNIGIGLHLNITKGKPLGSNYVDIIDDKGNFKKYNEIVTLNNEVEIKEEIQLQLTTFIEKFKTVPTHIDSHHHLHEFKGLRKFFFEIAKLNNIPIRVNSEEHKNEAREFGLKTNDILITDFFNNPNLNIIKKIFKKYKNTDFIIELMVHPGYMDYDTAKDTSYNYMREKELKELIKAKESIFFENIKENLGNYSLLNLSS